MALKRHYAIRVVYLSNIIIAVSQPTKEISFEILQYILISFMTKRFSFHSLYFSSIKYRRASFYSDPLERIAVIVDAAQDSAAPP